MATINDQGNVRAICPGCFGATSTFCWHDAGKPLGFFGFSVSRSGRSNWRVEYRLFKCSGCNRGGFGVIERVTDYGDFPKGLHLLAEFYPRDFAHLRLPDAVPEGIREEFKEAEKCFSIGCNRAAAGLFRSVLDKVLRDNGYKVKKGTLISQQIDMAAQDGVITESRQKRAHGEIKVLGNDVLHEEWVLIADEDVELSRHYCQRILEDFYDDRDGVVALLTAKKRLPVPES